MKQIWLSTPNVNVAADYNDTIDYTVVTVVKKGKDKNTIPFCGSPDNFIYWLFNHRCIMCKKYGTEINEITPRSRSKDALNDYRNRVPLCSSCHDDFHRDGVTTEKQRIMRMQREIFLIALGRKEFI